MENDYRLQRRVGRKLEREGGKGLQIMDRRRAEVRKGTKKEVRDGKGY